MTESEKNKAFLKRLDEKAAQRAKQWENWRPTIAEERYLEALGCREGFCVECCTWTNLETESDAEGHTCVVCEENSVFGAEQALVAGEIKIKAQG